MPQAALRAIEAATETLRSTLTLAQALALAGRQVDMTGLDREVAALCAAALALPASGRAPARRALLGLRRAVEDLLAAMPAPEDAPEDAPDPGPARKRGRASLPGPSARKP